MAMTKAELQEKYDTVTEERDHLLRAQAEFVDDVIAIATTGAVDHELCLELEASLKSLGLEPPTQVVTVHRTTVETYEFPGFEAQRSGLTDDDPEVRLAALTEGIKWGFGYDGNKSLNDLKVSAHQEPVKVFAAPKGG